jgi:4-hydroxyproline epimerase
VRPGTHRIDTPVGPVSATLHEDGSVSVANVPSYRHKSSVVVQVPGIGAVSGDVAWGGNWFFLVHSPVWELSIQNVETLTDVSWRIRQAVNAQGFPEVDHVELFGSPASGGHSRNFVLCPGKAYDRSPCGTGTSAKLACLAADGKLEEGQAWIQEGILGSAFRGEYRWEERAQGRVLPVVTGSAHVIAEATLILSDEDPFQWGIRPA